VETSRHKALMSTTIACFHDGPDPWLHSAGHIVRATTVKKVRHHKHLLARTVPTPFYPRIGGYNTFFYLSNAYSPSVRRDDHYGLIQHRKCYGRIDTGVA